MACGRTRSARPRSAIRCSPPSPATLLPTSWRVTSQHLADAVDMGREIGELRLGLHQLEPHGLLVALALVATDPRERVELAIELLDERLGLFGALGLDLDRRAQLVDRAL